MKKSIVLLLLFGLVSGASADWMYLTPVADSTITLSTPDTATPAGDLASVKSSDGNAWTTPPDPPTVPATELKHAYMQFEMPGGLTGAGIVSVESILFELWVTSPAETATFYTYGVHDGFDGASADTYTWNNAPGIDPLKTMAVNDHIYYSDPAEASWIGNFYSTAGPGPDAIDYVDGAFSNLVLNDTDGRLTVFLGQRQPWFDARTWASMESQGMEPLLAIEYTIPEPATMGLLGLGALAIVRRRRKA